MNCLSTEQISLQAEFQGIGWILLADMTEESSKGLFRNIVLMI